MFKIGDKFVVNAVEQDTHGFDVGAEVTLIKIYNDGIHEYKDNTGAYQWLSQNQVDLVIKESENKTIPYFKLERVGELVHLEINGKLSKETIEKILNLVW